MDIIYRKLSRNEIEKLGEIDRYEIIEEKYCFRDGNLILKKEHDKIKGWETGAENWIASLQNNYDEGGFFYGVFRNETLVGIAALSGEFIGNEKDAIRLATLFIDKNHRRRGIGSKLVAILKEEALRLNAKKMYVSASESKNAVHFYMNAGFSVTAGRIDELLDEDCPDDIHMEIVL